MDSLICELLVTVLLGIFSGEAFATGEVVYAVNCGGQAHTDLHGVHYQADRLSVGTASDFGKTLHISRVSPPDQILYQTERYHFSNFGYTIPIRENGDYVLVLKFSEVYFQGSHLKMFDVAVNQHKVIHGLDIYDKVGRGTAHDEYVPFKVDGNRLLVDDEVLPFSSTLYVEFLKGHHDNPKINAMVVMKGSVEDIPKLDPIPGIPDEEEDFEEDKEAKEEKPTKERKTSGPKSENPYANDDSSMLFPIFIAIGVFLPTLFCLCRL